MKFKLKKIYYALNLGRKYPYYYESKIEGLTDEVKMVIDNLPKTEEGNYLVSPSYMVWLMYNTDLHNMDFRKYSFRWYTFNKGEIFPIMTLGDTAIIDYKDIPTEILNLDTIDYDSRNEWANYLSSVTQEIMNGFPGFVIDGAIPYDTNIEVLTYNYYKPEPKKEKAPAMIHAFAGKVEVKSLIPKYKGIQHIEEVRPFEYSIEEDRLFIPRNIDPPNFELTLKLMRNIQKDRGISMKLSDVTSYASECWRACKIYEDKFKKMFNLPYIESPNGRKFSTSHPHYIILSKIGENPEAYPYKKKNNISFTKPNRVHLLNKMKESPDRYSEENINILKEYNDYLDLMGGPLRVGRPIFDTAAGRKSGSIDFKLREEDDRITYYCDLNLVKTNRITSANPNIQGMPQEIKSFITGSDDSKKILSIDIKAQEVMVLIFGILKNKTLKDLVLVNKDPYKSFAICAGLCDEDTFTQELKNLVKVPVLSVMNGKSKGNILLEMKGYENVAETILDLITKDPGYLNIVEIARKEQRNKSQIRNYGVVRRGLFGTEKQDDGYDATGSPYTQSLNANFQMTASEILSYGLTCMILDLKDKTNKFGLSLEQMTPLVPIYDEVIIEYDRELEEEVKELTTFYLCPQVEGWLELSGEITTGDNYVYKE